MLFCLDYHITSFRIQLEMYTLSNAEIRSFTSKKYKYESNKFRIYGAYKDKLCFVTM